MTPEKKTIHPDDLLAGIGQSIMGKAIAYSLIGHIIFTVATSVPLFKDWTIYGVKSPSAINAIRTEENRQKEEAERRRKAEEKAAAEAKAEAEAKEKAAAEAAKKGVGAMAPAESNASAASNPAVAEGDGKIVPPEVQPLPPKKEFTYGEDLSLD